MRALGDRSAKLIVGFAVWAMVTSVACSSGSDTAGSAAGSSAVAVPSESASSTSAASPSETAAPSTAQASSNSPVIAAVGDLVCAFGAGTHRKASIAKVHGYCKPAAVANLVKNGNYDAFMPLGDLQYSYGGYWRYLKYWDHYYGSIKDITYPVAGNHEAYNGLFLGYYHYFGKRAHPPGGYYSFNLGDWHVIALNSQMCQGTAWGVRSHFRSPTTSTGFTKWQHIPRSGCQPGDPMYKWAQRDLEKHANSTCTLALLHHPYYRWYGKKLFNPDADVAALWKLLNDSGVDVTLAGHQHNYQRYVPMDASGNADPNGMTEIIVGTGGDTYQPFPDATPPDVLASHQTGSYGILKMTLNPGGYDYEFVPIPGDPPFSDTGSGTCN